jgi:ribosome recycling factor
MNISDLFTQTEQQFKQAFEHLENELKKIRTGRASSSMLDSIKVEAYGTPMPLNQLATVSAPEPQLLQISPFDPNNIQSISQAIRDNQSLGFNPTDDGRIIRIPIPPLNEERRRDIVKQLGIKAEEAMIRMRNIRHEARETAEEAKKDKDIGEDEFTRFEKQVDECMQKYKNLSESSVKSKEQEIMTV